MSSLAAEGGLIMVDTVEGGVMLENDAWLVGAVLRRVREGRWRAHASMTVGSTVVSDDYLVEAPPHATIDARAFIVSFCHDQRMIAGCPAVIAFSHASSAVAAFRHRIPAAPQDASSQVALTVDWR